MTVQPASTPTGLMAGASLGFLRIDHLIGAGSLGAVYAATDVHGRRVAVKIFGLSDGNTQTGRDTLAREVTLNRQLSHPDIVEMLDAGVDGTAAYIVMELVPGRNLAQHVRPETLLPASAILHIGSRVAAALAHAHRRGILHRDVKPDNVLIDWPGAIVKLADFGIASLGDTFRTQTGVVLGTPFYMSPEQLCGGVIDGRTDLYALGVVLFETLSGQRPHRATTLGALLRQVASSDAPRLSQVRPDIPGPVCDLVATLLSRQPGQRPRSADEVASELDSLATRCAATDDGPKSRG